MLHYSIKPAVYPLALQELAAALSCPPIMTPGTSILKNHRCWFSAGHLAANLGVAWQQPFLAEALQGANEEWRPNGLLLSYPVLSSGELGHQDSFRSLLADRYETEKAALSLETLVNEQTPPTFLWHTLEDGLVLAENSLLFAEQLQV